MFLLKRNVTKIIILTRFRFLLRFIEIYQAFQRVQTLHPFEYSFHEAKSKSRGSSLHDRLRGASIKRFQLPPGWIKARGVCIHAFIHLQRGQWIGEGVSGKNSTCSSEPPRRITNTQSSRNSLEIFHRTRGQRKKVTLGF